MPDRRDKLALTETIGSVLWFLMDGLWMLNLPLAAKAIILPTLVVNFYVFRYTTRSFSQIAVVAAMNSWLVMNILWMIGDLDRDPKPIAIARLMFALGIVLLVLAVARGEGAAALLARFRRLRV